ncbi:prepilin-type N-terminal cleavage/methylation domain-containing protein [Pseudomonas putida]|uniref:prepilin-type N-terminal cleavage/methylation domain-containing protein n=1 Tax=Pseudomonas putida TaxID=303 RepID=UPI0022717D28|nr:prepilin-type N-terminal cleavage/methylation domain-containing protein [Pseudomonas putida]WAB97468.1 prepilin-type N-terminal cleavage/methylation domain-containing protein [Pseudomonas putida]
MHTNQRGMTLLEVLLAVAVVALGMFAAAGLQLQALQATDSARRDMLDALGAHTLLERGRAAGTLTVPRP